jgi:hypothetical protein
MSLSIFLNAIGIIILLIQLHSISSIRLVNADNNGWGAPALRVGRLGEGGFTTSAQSCQFTTDKNTKHVYDEDYQVPYAFQGTEWLSYENLLSIQAKVTSFVFSSDL